MNPAATRVHATTIIARNYLPYARVLAASFLEHHPDGVFAVLVLDDVDHTLEEPVRGAELVRPEDFVELPELHRMAMIYDVMELSTAVKPFLLRHLLQRGWPHVVYLDPDIRLYAPIDDLARLAEEHGIVLTPHTVEPMPRDDRQPSEFDILGAGVYNLGFLALGAESDAFLDYWSVRLRRDGLSDHQGMMFTDQRWVDFVPGYFPHRIVRDPAVNVAYWNADRRRLRWTGTGYEVAGRPLRLFHFSGYDPERPHLLSKHQGPRPRVLLSESPALARICDEYREALAGAGATGAALAPRYAYDRLPNGLPVDRRLRRIYRRALLDAEAGRRPHPPDPFTAEGALEFTEWVRSPSRAAHSAGLSRYLEALWADRTDLRVAFPELAGPVGDRFVEWLVSTGRFEEDIPEELVPAPPRVTEAAAAEPAPEPEEPCGVTVAGYFRAELGVGEAGRLLVDVVEAAGIPARTYTYTDAPSRQDHAFAERDPDSLPCDVNILCVNADRTADFHWDVGPDFFRGRYTIGMWAWETEVFPASMHHAFDLVDEVWGLSTFTADVLRRYTSKPVHALSLPIPIPIPAAAGGVDVLDGLLEEPRHADRFVFLFLFDYLSVFERKNPLGLVEAFRRAFAPDEGPLLLIKTLNGDKALVHQEQLLAAAADRPDVLVVDRYVTAEERIALIERCDAYVSLHRAEGFGLTMGEAMALGKPVIATAYSGNLDFMSPDNSFLVSHGLTPIPPGCPPYPVTGHWADPDLDGAAQAMWLVVERPDLAAERGRRAREDIATKHSVASRVSFVQGRLAEIRSIRAVPQEDPPSPVDRSPELIDRVGQLVAQPPGEPYRSRYGRLGELVRRTVIRTMRPYWLGQRAVTEGLFELVQEERSRREAAEVAAAAERRAELAEVQGRIGDLADLANRIAEVGRGVADLSDASAARFERLQARFERLQAHLDEAAGARIDDLARQVDELRAVAAQHDAALDEVGLRAAGPLEPRVALNRYPEAPPDEPWGEEYTRSHRAFVATALEDPVLIGLFREGAALPERFGVGFDERVVEYPWLSAQRLAGSVLDAGSALNHAHVLSRLRPRMDDLHIVTLEPEAEAFPQLRVSYLFADLRDLPIADERYDRIVSISTLEHVGMDNAYYGRPGAGADDPQRELLAAVRELRRVLKPGGDLYFTVPAGEPDRFAWVRALSVEELEQIVEELEPTSASIAYFRYSETGWQTTDRAGLVGARYRDHFTSGPVGKDGVVAAGGIACVHVVK